MTDVTTIDWSQDFVQSQQILAENNSLKKINWILVSMVGLIVLGSCVYLYSEIKMSNKKELNKFYT